MDDSVPLIIPEINPEDIEKAQRYHRQSKLHHRHYPRGVVSVAQGFRCETHFLPPAIGLAWRCTGAKAIEEPKRQVDKLLPANRRRRSLPAPDCFQRAAACGFILAKCFYTKEEIKMEKARRKIMHHPDFHAKVSLACVYRSIAHIPSR